MTPLRSPAVHLRIQGASHRADRGGGQNASGVLRVNPQCVNPWAKIGLSTRLISALVWFPDFHSAFFRWSVEAKERKQTPFYPSYCTPQYLAKFFCYQLREKCTFPNKINMRIRSVHAFFLPGLAVMKNHCFGINAHTFICQVGHPSRMITVDGKTRDILTMQFTHN